MFSKMRIIQSMSDYSNEITKLKEVLSSSDCVIVGAGAGLSSSAGLHIVEIDLRNISLILLKHMVFMICILVVFYLQKCSQKSCGHIGADSFISIAI